jgi:hypothetical protein
MKLELVQTVMVRNEGNFGGMKITVTVSVPLIWIAHACWPLFNNVKLKK